MQTDALYVQDGKIHSSDTLDKMNMYVSSLTERAKLSALILMKLADGALDDVLCIKGKKH